MKEISIKTKLFVLGIASLFYTNGITAQRCHTMEYLQQKMVHNPNLQGTIIEDNQKTNLMSKSINSKNRAASAGIYKIPVVVHLIGDAVISNFTLSNYAKIIEQIEILNEDYRKKSGTNGFGQGIDTQIEFCLAQTDPNGINTNGITETPGSFMPFDGGTISDYSLKHFIHWPEAKYLNIYVAPLDQEILGYATFPIELSTSPDLDGVVINESHFGYTSHPKYGNGRTLTHEVGHWLNLQHTWGHFPTGNDGDCTIDDGVSDTPVCDAPAFADFSTWCDFPTDHNQCSNENTLAGLTDRRQIENYMDYSDDLCMNMFTQGQTDRMRLALSTTRGTIIAPPEPLSLFSCEYSNHCSNGIQDADEIGIDCGGRDCQPCVGGGGDSGPPNPCRGLYHHLKIAGFYINGKKKGSTGAIEACVNENVIISGPNYQSTCNAYFFPNFDKKLFIAVTLCDENLNPIDVEYSKWQLFTPPNLLVYSNPLRDFLYVQPFNLKNYLPSPYIEFRSGQTYRVKIANSSYGGWSEYTNFIHFYEDNRVLNNVNITSNIYGKSIAISNSSVNANVVAEELITIKPSSTLFSGIYKIGPLNCGSFERASQGNNNGLNNNGEESFSTLQNSPLFKEEKQIEKSKFNIYPNPTTGVFNVDISSFENSALVEVYNVLGKQVFNKTISGDKVSINISDQSKGVYLIKITIGSNIFNEKIVYQ